MVVANRPVDKVDVGARDLCPRASGRLRPGRRSLDTGQGTGHQQALPHGDVALLDMGGTIIFAPAATA